MSDSRDFDPHPEQEIRWADGSAVLLRSFLTAAASVFPAREPADLYEGICRALAAHGLPALVLMYRADRNQWRVQAHRLSSLPPDGWHELPGGNALLRRAALLGPNRHPLTLLMRDENMFRLPALAAPFSMGEEGRTGVISVFAANLLSGDIAAIEALAALLGAAAGRIQAGQHLHEQAARLKQRVHSLTEELAVLYELSRMLSSAADDRAAAELTVRSAARAFDDCDGVATLICLDNRHTAVLAARKAVSPALHAAIEALLTRRLDAIAGAEHRTCAFAPLQVLGKADRRSGIALDGPLGPAIEAPIMAAGHVTGILTVLNLQPVEFASEHTRLLATIAGQLGAAVERLRSVRSAERERLAALVEGLPDGVVLLAGDHRILAANGIGRDRLAALCPPGVDALVPPAVAALAARARTANTAETIHLATDDESRRTITVTARRIQDVTGEPAVVLALHDTTEASLMRERLFQSEKMASVGQLVSGVAHELNNPLTGIMGFAQLLLAKGLDPVPEQQVATIFDEAERASKIVQNLLSFARRRRPEKTEVDVHALIDRVVALREYELKVNDIDLRRQFDPLLPSCLADPHQLQQVLLNVLTNAEQAVRTCERPRRITVTTSAIPGFVRIGVVDNGPGISPEHLRRVFDPFFTTKPVGEGTGLGLTITYGIIEEHGGRIDVDSRPGAGATVTIELPIAASDAPALAEPLAASNAAFRPHTILVVDDEAAIRRVLTEFLKQEGHKAEAASSGAEALERLAARRFDAVITDIRMPEMDGITFYQRVQERDPELARRIIFTSGDTVNRETRAFIQSTDIPFLAKPFRIDNVRELINGVLTEVR